LEFRLVAIRFDQENIYRFLTFAPAEHSDAFAKALRDSILSFRRLGASEAARLKPRRLRVIDIQAGDSLSDLVGKMAVPELHWEQFAILNGLYDTQEAVELKPGEKIKLITR
jgi:predicted Zn-dependent protease